MTDIAAPPQALPRPYLAWLWGVTVSQLGSAVLSFALGWAAAGLGGTTAALVLTLSGLPRVVLLLVGGAIADRVGARRILIVGETALLALSAALALALARFGTPTWLLVASSLAVGTVSAFCLPATGSMPRRLVPDDQLTRALALRQGLTQSVLLVAAPLGGLLVGAVGLPAIAWGDAVTFAVSLCVLVLVRELSGPTPDPAPLGEPPASEESVGEAPDDAPPGRARRAWLDLADGVRVVARAPGLRAALLLTGAVAALLLPVPSLLVPLLGRATGWGPGATGVVSGAVGVGVIAASLLAARRRASGPRAATVATGLALSAAGTLVLAASPAVDGPGAVVAATVGGLVFGFGNGTFVARVAPLVLGSAPRTHLARVQALVGLVQIVPVMVTNLLLGALAEAATPTWALVATAAGLTACASWARGRRDHLPRPA